MLNVNNKMYNKICGLKVGTFLVVVVENINLHTSICKTNNGGQLGISVVEWLSN